MRCGADGRVPKVQNIKRKSLGNKFMALENKLAALEKTLTALENELTALENKLKALENKLKSLSISSRLWKKAQASENLSWSQNAVLLIRLARVGNSWERSLRGCNGSRTEGLG